MNVAAISTTGAEPPAAPAVAGSFRIGTQLMQDVLQANTVSVGSGDFNQEALFANPFKDAREEAVVIAGNGQLTYLERTDSSDTGWRQEAVPDASLLTFREVVVAVHPNGDVWAFASTTDPTASSLYCSVWVYQLIMKAARPDGTAECMWVSRSCVTGEWLIGPPDHRQGPQALCVSYSPDAGPLISGSAVINGQLYCGAVSAQLPQPGPPLSPWVVSNAPAPLAASPQGRLAGAGFMPASQYAGGSPVSRVYVYYVLDKGTLSRIAISTGGPAQTTVVSTRVKQFCGTWNVPNLPQAAPQGDIGFSYLDSENDDLVLGYGYGYGYPYERRTSALGFLTAAIWQDADGMIHVYGEDVHGSLQVLHQDAWHAIPHAQDRPEVVPAWTRAAPEHPITGGIGGYDLLNAADRVFAFDYDSSGKASYLVLYRPYSPGYAVWVVQKNTDPVTDPDNPPPPFKSVFSFDSTKPKDLFPYPLGTGDIMFAYDYEGTGCLDHLVVYRPGAGGVCILKRSGSKFTVVYQDPDGNFRGTPFSVHVSQSTRLFAFDYSGTGHADHLVIYTPAGRSAGIIARTPQGAQNPFQTVYVSNQNGAGNGIGNYNLDNPNDQLFAYDFTGSGYADHLVAYRPGVGTVWILEKDAPANKNPNLYKPVFNSSQGIGGYPMTDPADRLMAYSYGDPAIPANKPGHLVAYRPFQQIAGQDHISGVVWILARDQQADPAKAPSYSPVFESGDPALTIGGGDGIGGYDLADFNDQITVFDYSGSGRADHLVLYRPGKSKISILESPGGDIFQPVYQAPSVSTPVTVGLIASISSYQLDPYPDYKPSQLVKLSGVTAAEQYCINTQDVTTSGWATDKVRLPSDLMPDAHVVSHYLANATLLDTAGTPMPGHNVTVVSDSLVEVTIGDISYQVGPGRSITAVTNPMGKLVLSVDARGLSVPVIYLTTDGLSSGTAIDLAAPLNDYLAGKGTIPSQQGTFTAGALTNATCTDASGNTAPLVKNWDDAPLNADQVVGHCAQMYGRAAGDGQQLTAMIEGYDTPQPVVGYVIQKWDPSRPSYQVFRTQAELDAYRAYRDSHPAYGGLWESFTSWASDVWEGIKTGAARVAEVIVEAVVEIAVWVGNAIVSLGQMIIEAIQQAIEAVEAVFQMIADAVMRLIDWLKSLFAFKDIWDTKSAIQGLLDQVPQAGINVLDRFGHVSHDWFMQQKADAHRTLADLRLKYSDTKMGDFGNLATPAKTSDGNDATLGGFQENPEANWATNKLVTPSSVQGQLSAELSGDGIWFLPELTAVLSSFGSTVMDLGSTIADALGDVFDDPAGVASAGFVALIDVAERLIDAVIDFCATILQKVLDLLRAFCTGLQGWLETPLPDGPVSWLWDWFMGMVGHPGTPFTIGNLGCLLVAYPVTIIYKAIFGVDNPPCPGGGFLRYADQLKAGGPYAAAGSPGVPSVPGWPDGYSCCTYDIFDGIITGLLYNLFACLTNWPTGTARSFGRLYVFFDFLAFFLFYLPPFYSNNPIWWMPCAVWGLDAAFNLASVELGVQLEYLLSDANPGLLKNRSDLGAAAGGLIGFIALVTTCISMHVAPTATTDPGYSLAWASGVLGCVSTFDAFLMIIVNRAPQAQFAVRVIKTVIDALANLGSGACTIAGTAISIQGGLAINGVKWFGPESSISAALGPYTYPPISSISARVGIYYSNTKVSVTGGTTPYGYATTNDTDGIPGVVYKLIGTQVAFCGTPTKSGSYKWGVGVTDSSYPPFNTLGRITADCTTPDIKSVNPVSSPTVSTPVSTALSKELRVSVTDSKGVPVGGAGVEFTAKPIGTPPSTASSGTFWAQPDSADFVLSADMTSIQVPADSQGTATCRPFVTSKTQGSYQITASVPGFPGATTTFTCSNTASSVGSAGITVLNDGQSALTGNVLPHPLGATVKDGSGVALSNTLVTFTLPGPDAGQFTGTDDNVVYFDPASAQTISVLTDSSGRAYATVKTGAQSGENTVTITVPGSGVTVTGTFTTTPNARISVSSGDGQTRTVNGVFAALAALVTDVSGNQLQGVQVTFSADGTAGQASCTFSNGKSSEQDTSDGSGLATAAGVTANGIAGDYSVTASITGLEETAEFMLTNASGSAATASATQGNSQWAQAPGGASGPRVTGGSGFAAALQVTVLDLHGNPVPDQEVIFRAPGQAGASCTFSGGIDGGSACVARTDARGVAVSGSLAANEATGSYTVTATAVGTSTSASFYLGNSGTATSVAPQTAATMLAPASGRFAQPLAVVVKDADGNPVPGVTVTFTLPGGSGAPSAAFDGSGSTCTTTTGSAWPAAGVATSPALTANAIAGNWSATATVAGPVTLTASIPMTNT